MAIAERPPVEDRRPRSAWLPSRLPGLSAGSSVWRRSLLEPIWSRRLRAAARRRRPRGFGRAPPPVGRFRAGPSAGGRSSCPAPRCWPDLSRRRRRPRPGPAATPPAARGRPQARRHPRRRGVGGQPGRHRPLEVEPVDDPDGGLALTEPQRPRTTESEVTPADADASPPCPARQPRPGVPPRTPRRAGRSARSDAGTEPRSRSDAERRASDRKRTPARRRPSARGRSRVAARPRPTRRRASTRPRSPKARATATWRP